MYSFFGHYLMCGCNGAWMEEKVRMRRSSRTGLRWLALVFLGAAALVVVTPWIASRRDATAIQRLQERADTAIARHEKQYAAVDMPSQAARAPRGSVSQLTVALQDLGWQRHLHEILSLEIEKSLTGWTDRDMCILGEFMAENSELLEEIRSLAQRGELLYVVDSPWEGPAEGPLHVLQTLARPLLDGPYSPGWWDRPSWNRRTVTQMAVLLRLEAMLRARAGDTTRVLENCLAVAALSETLAAEPLLNSQIARVLLITLLFEDMAPSLLPGQVTPEQVRSLIQATAGLCHREAFADALATQTMSTIASMRKEHEGDVYVLGDLNYSPGINAVTDILYRSPAGNAVLSADRRKFAAVMERFVEAAQEPYYEVHHEIWAMRAEVNELSFLRRYTRSSVPTFPSVLQAYASTEAMVDLMRIGLLLETHYAESGSYPDSLDAIAQDLGGSVPVDPFTGQPYVYIPGEHTFTLYSVGANRHDNGGSHEYFGGDIVWRGTRPRYSGGDIVWPGTPRRR